MTARRGEKTVVYRKDGVNILGGVAVGRGEQYYSEPVPTDVEVGPDGYLYVSSLRAFPSCRAPVRSSGSTRGAARCAG